MIIENRPGGDGIVAINAFVAAHDDHVLLFAPTSSFTAHPFLHDHLPYKPSDLVPIVRVSNTIVTISVPAALGVNSLDQLVALARCRAWQAELGRRNRRARLLVRRLAEARRLGHHQSRRTSNPVDAANDLAEGRVQVYESALAIVRPQLQSGKIKLLAVTNSVPAPTEPDLPTVSRPDIRR